LAASVAEKPETFVARLRSLAMAHPIGTAQGEETGMQTASYVSVQLPQAHEGVGRALRVAYLEKVDEMPEDMVDLLDRLDKL
jgi:hypothetical protein